MKRIVLHLFSIIFVVSLFAQVRVRRQEGEVWQINDSLPFISCDSAVSRVLTMGVVLPPERVYLQFDNSSYFLGENIWFKAHVTSNNDDRPTELSKVLYVELLAPEGYVIKTEKYAIEEDGTCIGEIYLDPLYLSGFFEVRAYTRYMLNWGESMVFSRVFPVFDKVNGNNWDFKNIIDRKRGAYSYDIYKENSDEECFLNFYPEGGHLVAGVESRVAYELRYAGCECYEEVAIWAGNKEVLKTTPEHMGKGLFLFTPAEGVKYVAKTTVKDKNGKRRSFGFKLPAVEKEGVVLRVQQQEGSVLFNIKHNFTTLVELGFAVMHRSSIGCYNIVTTADTTFIFDSKELPEGVCRAVVFSGEVPLAERLFFVEHDTLLKDDKNIVKLNVELNKTPLHEFSTSPYEKITITAERDDQQPIDSLARFAVSVTDLAGEQKTSWGYNMYTYMLLGSELKGYIPNVARYFDSSNKERKRELDLLMLTNGWTAYDWSKLTTGDAGMLAYPEEGILLRGNFYMSVKNEKRGTRKMLPQVDVPIRFDISYDGKEVRTSAFRTGKNGSFGIVLKPFKGKTVAALSPHTHMKKGPNVFYTFALDRYFSPSPQLYAYWQCHLGTPAVVPEGKGGVGVTMINPFEYILSDIEIVEKKRESRFCRPPLSELRFDYLDEWEYAMDVTYMNGIYGDVRFNMGNNIYAEALGINELAEERESEDIWNEETKVTGNDGRYAGVKRMTPLYLSLFDDERRDRMKDYKDVLSASNVLKSIFTRHKLGWCWWLFPAVVKGEYNKDSVPVIDNEYLHGINVEKMVNFKEVVITSDKKKTESVDGGMAFWHYKSNALKNKDIYSIFYDGFLSPISILDNAEILNSNSSFYVYEKVLKKINGMFMRENGVNRVHGHYDAIEHPNHIAYLIPYGKGDTTAVIQADLSVSSSTRRYTRVQGYSESKQFYSPDYSRLQPDSTDHRRTLLWNPNVKAVDGKLQLDFYNSAVGKAFKVGVEGRGGSVFYSNDEFTETKLYPGDEVAERSKNIKVRVVRPEKDSLFWAKCEKEYKKAEMYFLQKRYGKALTFYIELAQMGFPPAIYKIGLSYLRGYYLKKNPTLAFEFMDRAAGKGHVVAQYELAMMYKNGVGVEKDEMMAVEWFKMAIDQGDPNAQYELAKLYLESVAMCDSVQGGELLRCSALQKHPAATYSYGLYMLATGVKNDTLFGSPVNCIRRGAELKDVDALLFMLAHDHEQGDYASAYKWARQLQLVGHHEGIKYMADCYLAGRVVRRNKRLAKDLYRDAKKKGNSEAERILKEW